MKSIIEGGWAVINRISGMERRQMKRRIHVLRLKVEELEKKEHRSHKCEGECAKHILRLLKVAADRMATKYGITLGIKVCRDEDGNFYLTKFGLKLHPDALVKLIHQLLNPKNKKEFDYASGFAGFENAIIEAVDRRIKFGFEDCFEDIGGKLMIRKQHCGKCEKGRLTK